MTKSGLDKRTLHLVKLRASQINGCAYCVDLHVKDALADGMDAQLLHLVAVWRESPFFDARDRAILEWTESVTLAAETGIPDAAFETVRAIFSETDIAKLTIAIGTINIWNRIAVSSRMQHRSARKRTRLLLDRLPLDPDIDVRGYEMQQEDG